MLFDTARMDFDKMHVWDLYSRSLGTELRQCRDEGRDVAAYEALCADVTALPLSPLREDMADLLFRALTTAPMRPDYPYTEPDDLQSIRALRPEKRPELPAADLSALDGKVRGAWLGRIAGCLLGKPVEGMRTPDMHELLKNSGNFPLGRYMTYKDLQKTPRLVADWADRTWADKLDGCAPADDDTNYTAMAACRLIARYGRAFTPGDVAAVWMSSQPQTAYCTAERRAFNNFIAGIRPPQSATYKNPDREYIGAQIRADYFGYINPGDPETAADMAWRDACISHVKNGIYGEMFVAAMIAAAAVTDDMPTVIEAGIGQIPATSRLYEAVSGILSAWRAGASEDQCFSGIAARWDEFKEYDWVHTISNAEIVTASLLYGGGDYARTICRAVQTGFDTDCNGATTGSIVGMMKGDKAIPAAWTEPLCGTLETAIIGLGRLSIDELVKTTIGHMK